MTLIDRHPELFADSVASGAAGSPQVAPRGESLADLIQSQARMTAPSRWYQHVTPLQQTERYRCAVALLEVQS